jgi:hypothetical protein
MRIKLKAESSFFMKELSAFNFIQILLCDDQLFGSSTIINNELNKVNSIS